MAESRKSVPAPLVALAAWLFPGAGYWLVGQRGRGTVIGITIVIIFVTGLLVGGVSVVQAPEVGDAAHATSNILQKPWFIGQALAGPIALGVAWMTAHATPALPVSLSRSWEIGTLYTAVAGMLNLMAVIDSAWRAGVHDMTPPYEYTRPFIQPLPVWNYWYLLLIPLCAGVAVVYKSIKCESLATMPREAVKIFFYMLGGMLLAGVALAGLLRIVELAAN